MSDDETIGGTLQSTLAGDIVTRVVNKYDTDTYDVDITRSDGGSGHLNSREIGREGWLGNPYPKSQYGRGECIERFRADFEARLDADTEFRAAVADLSGQALGCVCAPKPCHGEVIAEWADRLAADTEGGQ